MKRFLPNHLFPVSMRGILMLLILVVFVPLLIVQGGIYTAWYYSRWAEQESTTLDTAQEVAATFEAFIFDVHRQESAIGATLTGPHPYTTKEANDFLTIAGQGYPSIRCWSWTNPEGKVIASSQLKAVGWNCVEEAYFQDLRSGRAFVVSDHRIDPISGVHAFVIASRINDPKGSMSGAVVATVEVDSLAKRAVDLFRPVGEAIALFDRQGILVYNSRHQDQVFQDWRTIDPFLADALQTGENRLGVLALANDGEASEKYIVARVPIGNIGWVAGARLPVARAMTTVYTGLWIACGLNLLVVVGSGLLTLTIAAILIHQLRRLQMHAQAIGRGDYSHSSETTGVRELAQLATAFNQTGVAVRKAQEALEAANATLEQRVRQRTAELAATIQRLEKIDEELRAASLYARGLIEASLDPLVTISLEGKVTDVNEATAAAVGVPREQIIGRDFADYFTEPDKARDGYRIVLSQGLVRDYALTIRHASGSETDVLYNAVVYRNEAGEVQGVFAAARDVTERRRMEKELDKYRIHLEELVQQRTEQLEAINKQLKEEIAERKRAAKEIERLATYPTLNPNPISEIDLEGRLHYVNPATERLFPDLHDRGTGHPWLAGWEAVASALRGGDEQLATREVIVGDRCFQQTIHYVEQIQRIRIYGLDITQRKQSEQAIQEREEELSAIYENAPLVMLVMDHERRVRKANRLAEQFSSASAVDLLSRRGGEALRCVHSLDDPRGCGYGPDCQRCLVRSTIAQTLETGVSQNQVEVGLSCIVQGETQAFTFLLSTARLNIHGQPQVLVTILDISDRKRAEEALQRAAEQLKRSNEELEQFAYVASHDLQEPLRVVNGYVQLIERKFKDQLDADAKQFIFYIVDGVERMRQLITDLLNYSRVDTRGKEFHSISVQAVLNRVSENLKRVVEESGAVIAYSSLPEVHADEPQLIQLFQNLIANGIKFHGENPPRIEISASREGGKWVFAVRDNGIGIDRPYWDKIFVIFQRLHTRQKYQGTGIGLAICKRIVERHGGKIWLDSQLGHGTTFYFTLS